MAVLCASVPRTLGHPPSNDTLRQAGSSDTKSAWDSNCQRCGRVRVPCRVCVCVCVCRCQTYERLWMRCIRHTRWVKLPKGLLKGSARAIMGPSFACSQIVSEHQCQFAHRYAILTVF